MFGIIKNLVSVYYYIIFTFNMMNLSILENKYISIVKQHKARC